MSQAYAYPLEYTDTGELADASPANAGTSRHRAGFVLFLLVNAVLFIRPAELIPSLINVPIYEMLILLCLLCSLPAVFEQLQWKSLKRNPVTLAVVLLLPAVFISNLGSASFYDARMGAIDFAKILVFYLLLVGLVNSEKRLGIFLVALVVFVMFIAGLALLQWHEVIDIPALSAVQDNYGTDDAGEAESIKRLIATGVFNDPNDFALILVATILVSIHFLTEQKRWLMRIVWLAPIAALGYAIILTRSRGGFLALIGGLFTLTVCRLGWKKAIPVILIALPILLFVFGGRQTDIDLNNEDDTAQGRIQLWRDGLVLFHSAPIFGIGKEQFAEQNVHVAHNSYVHSFAELGFFGGSLFVAALILPMLMFWRMRGEGTKWLDTGLASLRPCLFAVAVGYCIGLNSLSRCYAEATYVIIGLGAVYWTLAAPQQPQATPAFSKKTVKEVAVAVAAVLIYLHVFVKIFAA